MTDVKLGMTWNTYIGSIYGALTKSGYWQGEISNLMGMTGMAFHFIIHKQLCPSSVTVYDWLQEHLEMMDKIGIYSEITCIMNYDKRNTYKLVQQEMVQKIKSSIDRNIPVVVWAPTDILEFGLITGYDDEDQVFHVTVCHSETPDPLLYANLGKSQIPIMYVDFIKDKIDIDKEKIYHESLQFALEQWKRPFHSTPDYASGYSAYNNLISSLENRDYNAFGLTYIIASYCDSKEMILSYLKEIQNQSKTIKNLEKIIADYEKIAEGFKKLTQLFPFQDPKGENIDEKDITTALPIIRKLKDIENDAMIKLENILD